MKEGDIIEWRGANRIHRGKVIKSDTSSEGFIVRLDNALCMGMVSREVSSLSLSSHTASPVCVPVSIPINSAICTLLQIFFSQGSFDLYSFG